MTKKTIAVVPAAEAFARVGVKHTKGYELIKQHKLDARKQGSRTVVTTDSIEKLIASLPKVALGGAVSTKARAK